MRGPQMKMRDAGIRALMWTVCKSATMRGSFVCAGCRGSPPRSGEGRRAFGRFSTPHPGGSPQGGEDMMEELNAGL